MKKIQIKIMCCYLLSSIFVSTYLSATPKFKEEAFGKVSICKKETNSRNPSFLNALKIMILLAKVKSVAPFMTWCSNGISFDAANFITLRSTIGFCGASSNPTCSFKGYNGWQYWECDGMEIACIGEDGACILDLPGVDCTGHFCGDGYDLACPTDSRCITSTPEPSPRPSQKPTPKPTNRKSTLRPSQKLTPAPVSIGFTPFPTFPTSSTSPTSPTSPSTPGPRPTQDPSFASSQVPSFAPSNGSKFNIGIVVPIVVFGIGATLYL